MLTKKLDLPKETFQKVQEYLQYPGAVPGFDEGEILMVGIQEPISNVLDLTLDIQNGSSEDMVPPCVVLRIESRERILAERRLSFIPMGETIIFDKLEEGNRAEWEQTKVSVTFVAS